MSLALKIPGKSQNIGFRTVLFRIPRKITKLPRQHSMLGHHRHASETPFKMRFAGGPMMARFCVVFGSTHQLKNMSKLDPL